MNIASEWNVLFDEPRPAADQMAFDERLARLAMPVARLFTWSPPAVSFGFKQPRPAWAGMELVERPTGGGIAFHGSDVSISVTIPRSLAHPLDAIMRSIGRSAVRLCGAYGVDAVSIGEVPAQKRIDYCLTQPNSYAVRVGQRKIAGYALRRFPDSWLIQGSLLVRPLPDALARRLPQALVAALERQAVPLLEASRHDVSERDVARCWSERWVSWWAPEKKEQAQSSNKGER